jgi:hypothetical protein
MCWSAQVGVLQKFQVLVTFEDIRDEYGTYTKFFDHSAY